MTLEDPVKVAPGVSGLNFTNESDVEQYVVIKVHGKNIGGEFARTVKLLLAPKESRTVVDLEPGGFDMTVSTDTSPARGKINFVGGCGPGCEHDPI